MKNHLSVLAFVAALAVASPFSAVAQQAHVNLEHDPQKNKESLVPFGATLISPEVRDDRTVTFRVKAPSARQVSLGGGPMLHALGASGPVPMTRGVDSVWTLTIGPVAPNMYVYNLVIDGVAVVDPNNTIAGYAAMPAYSLLVVHGDGPAYYDARKVPHGAVTRHIYHSATLGGEREMYVYTPPGYDRTRTYPVLYLLGGSGELANGWMHDGRVNFIADNLIAEGRARPMVIVMPNNQVVHRRHPDHTALTFDRFEAELRTEIMPLVETTYAVRTDRRGRAIAGLSMGGRHAQLVGFRNLDLFASFGILSAGDPESETSSAAFLRDPAVNEKVDYLFVGQGTAEDRPGTRTNVFHDILTRRGVEHEYYVGGGGAHDWGTWRHLVHERFLPGLWRGL